MASGFGFKTELSFIIPLTFKVLAWILRIRMNLFEKSLTKSISPKEVFRCGKGGFGRRKSK